MREQSEAGEQALPPRPVFPTGSSGIITERLGDQLLVQELQANIDTHFPHSTDHYTAMPAEEFRQIVLSAQEELNVVGLARRLASDRRGAICRVLVSDRPMIQTNLYLRATRPHVTGVQENIGWHRESFYGPDMDQSVNFWVPIANVSAKNAMRFIPDSHLIPDAEIKTVSEPDVSVERFSAGHKIGLLYAPKEIISGVDLSNPRPLLAAPGEAVVFAGALIHGAAANRSDKIRFSVDFRLIAEESLTVAKDHFASGKSYFEPL